MKKFIFTFGSNQLQEIKYQINPMDVMLVVEAENENLARKKVFNSFIGEKFCTSYPYDLYAEEFVIDYEMKEKTLDELEKMKEGKMDESINYGYK